MHLQSLRIFIISLNANYRIAHLMPSRANDSFLQYPFKNLGFMRFPEPVFAGIYQNISYFLCMLTFWTYLMRYTYP